MTWLRRASPVSKTCPVAYRRPKVSIGKKLLTIQTALFYGFLYVPILVLVIFSFNNSKSVFVWRGFTWAWYQKVLQDQLLLLALKNTLLVAVVATLLSTIFGTMVAVALERWQFKFKLLLDALLFLPVIIPDIAMGVMLLAFFSLVAMPQGLMTVIIAHVAYNISFVALIVRARLATFDRRLEEAAQDLGANEWQTFWRVTFPLLLPGILGGALTAFTLSLDDYVITYFTSGHDALLSLRIYSRIKMGITPDINALSSLMLLVSMALVVLSLIFQGKGSIENTSISH